ncbi:uncharacterized protein LOC129796636 [Lutzomyia longipalpis]|uniref:Uncharacterized protein n=1 Tax=Lutzomyia longipalpis TaxID=7200 RepID=A0A7G3AVA6_LUTLO|nr:uncharacterized protein LOC129796636 [Lutzomyia longipalpis]
MDLQNQIYVLAGVFGGVSLLLLLFVSYLMLSMSEMHSRIKSRDRSDRSDRRSKDDFAYANPSIVAGEELNRRGYHMHDAGQAGHNDGPSGLAAAAANRFRSQISSDVGTKDASRDFSSILNNDAIIFGGGDGNSGRRSKSIPIPPPPLGKPSNYNDNFSYNQNTPVNPLGRQDRGYFNSRGGGY